MQSRKLAFIRLRLVGVLKMRSCRLPFPVVRESWLGLIEATSKAAWAQQWDAPPQHQSCRHAENGCGSVRQVWTSSLILTRAGHWFRSHEMKAASCGYSRQFHGQRNITRN